jgi:hypothetical protein
MAQSEYGDSKGRPGPKVICRILGFAEQHCNGRVRGRVTSDPVVNERRDAAMKNRPDRPGDCNIFYSYKMTPLREEDAHLNFPENFNLEDGACVLAIFNKMMERERQELRDRVLDEQLQAGLAECLQYEAFFKMSAAEQLEMARKLA